MDTFALRAVIGSAEVTDPAAAADASIPTGRAPLQRGVAISLREPNDVLNRYEEDAALLASIGIARVRLAVDWAALQPRPAGLDPDSAERYRTVIAAMRSAGIGVDLGLADGAQPGWFDDEGGFGDRKTAGRWWPRWVEACADTFGDVATGWFPLARPLMWARPWRGDSKRYLDALGTVAIAWRDAWRILHGSSPVICDLGVRVVRPADETVPARSAARIEDHLRWRLWLRALRDGVVTYPEGGELRVDDLAGSVDILGISTTCDAPTDRPATDETVERWAERLGSMLRRVAEDGPDRPVAATLSVPHRSDDDRRHLLSSSAHAVVGARDDGVPLVVVYVAPGIDSRAGSTEGGIIDRDRNLKRSGDEWLSSTSGS